MAMESKLAIGELETTGSVSQEQSTDLDFHEQSMDLDFHEQSMDFDFQDFEEQQQQTTTKEQQAYMALLLLQKRHKLTNAAVSDITKIMNMFSPLEVKTSYQTIVNKAQIFQPLKQTYMFTSCGKCILISNMDESYQCICAKCLPIWPRIVIKDTSKYFFQSVDSNQSDKGMYQKKVFGTKSYKNKHEFSLTKSALNLEY
ncbi:hypothetical protein BLOT_001990 [Blomia tropicalis]|nr:hypothetical protein BLOT_001990 [Blomia tropicalis]